jgi:hypothetical protein
MGIHVLMKDENGTTEAIGGTFVYRVGLPHASEYPLLSGIDPTGDTMFNAPQTRSLMSEVDLRLNDTSVEPDERHSLEELKRFWYGNARVHRYLWFIGD